MILESLNLQEETLEFASLLEGYCHTINERGLDVQPYTEKSLRQFETLPEEKRAEVVARYRKYFSQFVLGDVYQFPNRETAEEEARSIHDFLRRTGASLPEGEDLSWVEPNWVIEVYDLNFTQIYRNIEFHRQCQYDVATLESNVWMDLYERDDDKVTMSIFEFGRKMLTDHKTTMQWPVRKHVLKEIMVDKQRAFLNEYMGVTPLFKDGKHFALINFVKSTPLETNKNGDVIDLNWN